MRGRVLDLSDIVGAIGVALAAYGLFLNPALLWVVVGFSLVIYAVRR